MWRSELCSSSVEGDGVECDGEWIITKNWSGRRLPESYTLEKKARASVRSTKMSSNSMCQTLRIACMANDLPTYGSAAQLLARLG